MVGNARRYDTSDSGRPEPILQHVQERFGWGRGMPRDRMLPAAGAHQGLGRVPELLHPAPRDLKHRRNYHPFRLPRLGYS